MTITKDVKKIFDILYSIRGDAEERDYNDGYNFNSENYKWELGAEIAYTLKAAVAKYPCESIDEKSQCMGIDIEYNYENPNIIRLWKKNFEVIL